MKKIFTLLVTLGLSASSFAATTVKTAVDWGRKKHGCDGFGICYTKTTTTDGENIATLILSDDATMLTMTINESALLDRPGQILNGKFIQEEDYTFPNDICIGLNVPGCITIPAGRYPAQLANEKYTIQFIVTDIPTSTN